VTVKIAVIWDVTPCSFLHVYGRFGGRNLFRYLLKYSAGHWVLRHRKQKSADVEGECKKERRR
jgi:hypothetical protein